jgi:hypothetical protein
MLDEERKKKAIENLREIHRRIGTHTAEDEAELTAILGDSPEEADMAPVRKGARPRPGSASTRTA